MPTMRLIDNRSQRASCPEAADTKGIRDLSARLAANHLLVQASTGNTSIKTGDTLWMKVSGKWLSDAASPDFLIPVALQRARECLDARVPIPETENTGGACASIETAMHVVLPHKVVVHVHSVNAIAWAVRADAPRALQHCLRGFAWQWIPYVQSGTPLAQLVRHASRIHPETDVFVLGNHGLVVCGESCDLAEQLLNDVEACLHLDPRPAVDLVDTCGESNGGFQPFEWASIHTLACDTLSRTILAGGVLYPCQALFLPSTVCAGERSSVGRMDTRQNHSSLLDGVSLQTDRVQCSPGISQCQRELLLGLSHVVRRIHQPAAVRYLSKSEVSEVLQGGGQYLANASIRRESR